MPTLKSLFLSLSPIQKFNHYQNLEKKIVPKCIFRTMAWVVIQQEFYTLMS